MLAQIMFNPFPRCTLIHTCTHPRNEKKRSYSPRPKPHLDTTTAAMTDSMFRKVIPSVLLFLSAINSTPLLVTGSSIDAQLSERNNKYNDFDRMTVEEQNIYNRCYSELTEELEGADVTGVRFYESTIAQPMMQFVRAKKRVDKRNAETEKRDF